MIKPKPSYKVVQMRKGQDLGNAHRLALRFEIVSDGKEIACIVEGADDQYCGHGQTPESAMVDLFGKLGAI